MEEGSRWQRLIKQLEWEHGFVYMRLMVIYVLYYYTDVNPDFAHEIYKHFFAEDYHKGPSYYNALVRFREMILTIGLQNGNIEQMLDEFFSQYGESETLDDIYSRLG